MATTCAACCLCPRALYTLTCLYHRFLACLRLPSVSLATCGALIATAPSCTLSRGRRIAHADCTRASSNELRAALIAQTAATARAAACCCCCCGLRPLAAGPSAAARAPAAAPAPAQTPPRAPAAAPSAGGWATPAGAPQCPARATPKSMQSAGCTRHVERGWQGVVRGASAPALQHPPPQALALNARVCLRR